MALIKIKLGDFIYPVDEKNIENKYNEEAVVGLSTQKTIIRTKAELSGVRLSSYKIFAPGQFAYVPDTSRRGDKVSLAFNSTKETYLVSSISIVFGIKYTDKLLPLYLFIFFNRPEFDRYARFNSWGAAREAFSWEDLCEIDLELPDIPTQQKYVDIYDAMIANQQSYERGLEDLKLVCDGYFDSAKKERTIPLIELIESVDSRNSRGLYSAKDVKGITNNKEFAETKADISSVDLTKFKIVEPGEFAYNSRTDGRDMLVLALNRGNRAIIVTFNYNVFKIRKDKEDVIVSEYLYAFLNRAEFDRQVRFSSWGSSQELLSWNNLCDFQIPLPTFKEQCDIAEIFKSYTQRKKINEQLKEQIREMCPILIKGSLEEGKKIENFGGAEWQN